MPSVLIQHTKSMSIATVFSWKTFQYKFTFFNNVVALNITNTKVWLKLDFDSLTQQDQDEEHNVRKVMELFPILFTIC